MGRRPRRLEPAPAAGWASRRLSSPAGGARGPARRSTGAGAPSERLWAAARVGRSLTRVQRRRIEAETVPPLPCTDVSGHASKLPLHARRQTRFDSRRGRPDTRPRMRKRRVAVVGATGVAGQQFLASLAGHPWFEVAVLAASARSAGRPYGEAIREASGARRWWVAGTEPAPEFLTLPVVDAAHLDPDGLDLVFAAVESDAAREIEPAYARAVPVISTAAAFRYETDTPIALPGVNVAAHLPLLAEQRRRRGWKGFVLPLPNCTTVGLAISLKPPVDRFRLARVLMTSLQGISGAGRSPGVVALDIVDNVIPFIPKEEEKVAAETRKILGRLGEGGIEPHPAPVGATCTRVGVLEGHTLSVMVETERPCDPAAAADAMRAFRGDYAGLGLPSAPAHPILVHDDPFRPQPRLDRDAEGGMATSVGRLRAEPALRNGLKYVALSHNTRMGAAHGAVLAAEHLCHAGVL